MTPGLSRATTVDLTGEWAFRRDPDGSGQAEEWTHGGDWSDAESVTIPHVWQEAEAHREYTGTAWYRTTFDGGEITGNRTLLYFGAVDYEATVWLNGVELGRNAGGYLPFRLDASEALVDGTNELVVRVTDPEDLREIPHGKQGEPWYTRASGIWQQVALITVPETYVANARATPDRDAGTVRFEIELGGTVPEDGIGATVRVDRDGTAVVESAFEIGADGSGTVDVRVDDPVDWSPSDPQLYEFTIELESGDEYEDYFGFRSIRVDDGEVYLNGEPLRIRGALDQAYYPDTLLRPADLETYREEIETAKELGFNMLRKHIKPPHPRFVELADRLGLLVWAEPANPDRYTERSRREIREQFEGMVQRDYNSPSVVIWSLYNEEWGIGLDQHDWTEESHPDRLWNDGEKQAYLAEFFEEAKELDPTRLVCDNSGWAHVATDLNDFHEYFVVPDRERPWRDRLAELLATPEDNYATTDLEVAGDPGPEDAPVLVSEFGTWGFPSLSRLEEHYGGDPHWFDHDHLSGLKRPAGVRTRFEESHLSTAFDDVEELAAVWQRRELESIAGIIADMRATEELPGYVITEFSDIEWEFNGILEYTRDEKELHDAFARVNGPTMVRLEPDRSAVAAGSEVVADLIVANDTGESIDAEVHWELLGETGTATVSVEPRGVERMEDAVSVTAPDVADVTRATATAQIDGRDAGWDADVVVVPEGPPSTTVAPADGAARDVLESAGVPTTDDPDDAAAVVATAVTDDLREFASAGGDVLLLPSPDGSVDDAGPFEVEPLAEGESWNLCASFVHQRLFPDLDALPGRAFEGTYPHGYVADPTDEDEVLVGYAEGWLANVGGVVVERPVGDGTITACTLRVGAAPEASGGAVLSRLLERVE